MSGSTEYLPKKVAVENPGSLILQSDDFIPTDKLVKKGIGLAISFRGCSLGAEGIDAAAAYLSVQSMDLFT